MSTEPVSGKNTAKSCDAVAPCSRTLDFDPVKLRAQSAQGMCSFATCFGTCTIFFINDDIMNQIVHCTDLCWSTDCANEMVTIDGRDQRRQKTVGRPRLSELSAIILTSAVHLPIVGHHKAVRRADTDVHDAFYSKTLHRSGRVIISTATQSTALIFTPADIYQRPLR